MSDRSIRIESAGDARVTTTRVDGPPKLLRMLARKAAEEGRRDEAQDLLLRAAAKCERDDGERRRLAVQLNNLAGAYGNDGHFRTATELLQKAVALRPDYVLGHVNLGEVLSWRNRPADALDHFDQALGLDSENLPALYGRLGTRLMIASWTGLERDAAHLVDQVRARRARGQAPGIRPPVTLPLDLDAAERLWMAEQWSAQFARPRMPPPPMRSARPLRIGYVSADFRRHATTYLLRTLFAAHDRRRVAVHAYSIGPGDESAERRGIIRDCDRFVDLGRLGDEDAAMRIRSDGIDILVDLMGHTRLARPTLLARRPAPIQVSFLGYPATTGAPWIDYIVADRIVLPSTNRSFFSEKAILLPHCYQVNDPTQEVAPGPGDRAEWGLPSEAFVFACFSATNKIEPGVFALWMRILGAVPGSLLWLLADSETVRRNLRAAAAAQDIDPSRIVFSGRIDRPQHLRRQRCADLFLDTLVCNAHTTASDALFVGLPLLTSPGDTFASRVAASLLTTLGVEELIASDREAYCATAIALAGNPARLADLGSRIEHAVRSGPLFDVTAYARDLERGFELAWKRHMDGDAPVDIEIPSVARSHG